MVYIASSGAAQMLDAQQVHANNLANVKTQGFKADLVQLSSTAIPGQTLATRTYALAHEPATDFSPADIISTDSELDIAIRGEGWFAVQNTDGKKLILEMGNYKLIKMDY